jgi:hypothetical protein
MEESEPKNAKKHAKNAMKQQALPPSSSSNKPPAKPNAKEQWHCRQTSVQRNPKKSVKHMLLLTLLTKSSFPKDVHAMITEIACLAPNVMSWIEGGEAFIIHDPNSSKLAEVLQKHFHCKFDCYNLLVYPFFLLIHMLFFIFCE